MADEDHPSNPGTAPFVPDFDTGTQGFVPDFDDTGSQPSPELPAAETEPEKPPETPPQAAQPDSVAASVQSVTVPGRYQYLKWWKFALVVFGVWVAATEVGLSLFYWWYHTSDKTAALFTVLVYVVACVVSGVMLAMVEGRPMISALSLALMSGPFASVAAAVPLYGYYHCERVGECVLGIIPY